MTESDRSHPAAATPGDPWWRGVPPVTARVQCAGQSHRLQWAAGQVLALDHPQPDRERTLGALAGDQPRCLELLDAWQRHSDDPRVLVLASRGPADPLPPGDDAGQGRRSSLISHGRHPSAAGWTSYTPMATATTSRPRRRTVRRAGQTDDPNADLLELLALGVAWSDRLTATVLAGILGGHPQRPEPGPPSAVLHAALYGRAVSAARMWAGNPGAEVDLTIVDDAADAAIRIEDHHVALHLPVRWLPDVWARGAAVVLGRFCLSATMSGDHALQLITADSEGVTTELTILLGRNGS